MAVWSVAHSLPSPNLSPHLQMGDVCYCISQARAFIVVSPAFIGHVSWAGTAVGARFSGDQAGMELPSRNGEIQYTRTVQCMYLLETWQKVLDRGRAGQGMPLEKATCEGRPAENADLSHTGIWGESIPSRGARVAGRVSRQSVGEEARSSWRVLWTSKGTWAFTLSLEGVKFREAVVPMVRSGPILIEFWEVPTGCADRLGAGIQSFQR